MRVKVERCRGNIELITRLVDGGVPVMGHLGMTPQSVNEFGGFKIQARNGGAAQALLDEALELEESGCFSIVLECIPSEVAERVTDALGIPTIGIGSGPETSGQVLVLNDLLGLTLTFSLRLLSLHGRGSDDYSGSGGILRRRSGSCLPRRWRV